MILMTTTMNTASLPNLAQELQDLISIHLTQQDIAALASTNRALHAAMTPSLYKNINLKLMASDWRHEKLTLAFVSKITSLLRTFVREPIYASHVTRASFRVENDKQAAQPVAHPFYLSSEDKTMVDRAIAETQFSEAPQWEGSSTDWATGTLLALVIARLSNVEDLIVDYRLLLPSGPLFASVLRKAAATPSYPPHGPRFDKLSRFTIRGLSGTKPKLHGDITMLPVYLPALTELELHNISDIIKEEGPRQVSNACPWPLETPATPKNLRTLRFKNAGSAEKTIGVILQQTPNLTTLECDFYIPSSQCSLDLEELADGLSHIAHTVQSLTITYELYPDEALDVESLNSVLSGSLRALPSFTALTELNISPFLLFGEASPDSVPPLAQLLPPNLTRLVLNDCLFGYDALSHWWEEDLKLFAAIKGFLGVDDSDNTWRSATPHLREVVLDMRRGYDYLLGNDDGWLTELRTMCEKGGLKFTYLNSEPL